MVENDRKVFTYHSLICQKPSWKYRSLLFVLICFGKFAGLFCITIGTKGNWWDSGFPPVPPEDPESLSFKKVKRQ